jgi:DNA-binding PadR family transcriptional regulator
VTLRLALLAILTAEPMTGWDLVKYFDGTVAFLWRAPHSQIYPQLRKMEEEGLIEAEVVPRGEHAEKRIYRISDLGIAELKRWASEPLPVRPQRDPQRLHANYFEWGSFEAARVQLGEHLDHYTAALRDWERFSEDLEARRVPLLRRRLESRPREEHEAIVAFKLFAFGGEISRAKMEIAWAKEGLALLDRLEAAGAKLTGDAIALP